MNGGAVGYAERSEERPGEVTMNTVAEREQGASLRRMVLLGAGGFVALLMASTVALWFAVGTTVFFELLAAGIAYCF
jgi:hypothetical protein